jgi:hypothetical protein
VTVWKRELPRCHDRIAGLFVRTEARERSLAYLQGLMSHCERKSGCQLAERMGEASPYRVQHLLDRARWDADAARDQLRDYVLKDLSSPDAMLIADETGFLKKASIQSGSSASTPVRRGASRTARSAWFSATPATGFMRPSMKRRSKRLCSWPDNAGKLNKPSRPPRASVGWTIMKSATGKAVIGTSLWPCWTTRCLIAVLRARREKTPDGQVPLSVPELRHLLTHLLWGRWCGIEHLLHWSRWPRPDQFHALRCYYRKRGSPLPVFYLQL